MSIYSNSIHDAESPQGPNVIKYKVPGLNLIPNKKGDIIEATAKKVIALSFLEVNYDMPRYQQPFRGCNYFSSAKRET